MTTNTNIEPSQTNRACAMTPKEMMKTTTNTAATRDQVREPTRELTEDELVLVSGGTPSSASNDWRCHIHPN
jgi:hypothetical protein